MKTALTLSLLSLLTACSSVRKQRSLGAVLGSVALGSLGASIGRELSPNPQSDKLNEGLGMAIGGPLGLYLGAKTADYLWEERPTNAQRKTLLHPDGSQNTGGRIRVLRPKNIKRIKLETELPAFLKGKVKEANIVTYELEAYEEETEDGRKIIHEPHKAYEYVLE